MLALIIAYWPHILAVLSVLMGTVAAVHATMTKEEVRSALGWVGVIVLSPIVGAVIYAIAGINRIRRSNYPAAVLHAGRDHGPRGPFRRWR